MTVQISESLFVALLRYHLDNDETQRDTIVDGLNEKIDAMWRRHLYTQVKRAQTQQEREDAIIEYLRARKTRP